LITGRSAALEGAALSYLKAHFPDGVTTVLSPTEASSHYIVQVVANKYNPTNFW
jgi:capping protein alpha